LWADGSQRDVERARQTVGLVLYCEQVSAGCQVGRDVRHHIGGGVGYNGQCVAVEGDVRIGIAEMRPGNGALVGLEISVGADNRRPLVGGRLLSERVGRRHHCEA